MDKIERILIIRTDRIGDLVLSTPALRALREKFPQANITLVVNPRNRGLAKAIPWINEVLVYSSLIKTAKILKKRKFDLAIDLLMDYTLKSALLAYLSGARYRLGYDIQGRGIFFNIEVKQDKKEKHIIESTLDIVRAIGVETLDKLPKMSLLDEDKIYIEEFLNQQNIESKDLLIGIHAGGHFPTQCWLPERFAELADKITESFSAKIIVIGGPNEEGLIHKVIGLMSEKAIEVVGISLSKLSALIARCNLFICNNSGPLHIASALGIPTVSTMGPTVSSLWWPQGQNHIVVKKDLACSPCNYGVCKNHQCMELITVEDMMEAVNRQLKIIKQRDKGVIIR